MDVKLPHLGEGADSGTVVNLLVKEGDQIAEEQPILELENEKAVATIPSTAAGTVTKVHVKTGDKISVGQKILSLSTGAAPDKRTAAPVKSPEPAEPEATAVEEATEEPPSFEDQTGMSPAQSFESTI